MAYSQSNLLTTDPAQLAIAITAGQHSEKEKARAIFDWITENISYYRMDVATGQKKNKIALAASRTQVETAEFLSDTSALPDLTDRVAGKVLKDRKAVCEGYARLFKSLCDHAGLRAEIITGYARSDINKQESKFRSNHTWNAVYFDSAWHLIDATWASGYMAFPTGEFVKFYDGYYFMTPPELFIRHHHPDDLRWTLLSNIPAPGEFRLTPFRQRSFSKYGITSFFPRTGIIEAVLGDTLKFELHTGNPARNMTIAPDSLWESSHLMQSIAHAYVNPDQNSKGEKVTYRFPVSSLDTEWLYVMYNNDAVLRYKLKVRPGKTAAGD
jgi:hypothetical protein